MENLPLWALLLIASIFGGVITKLFDLAWNALFKPRQEKRSRQNKPTYQSLDRISELFAEYYHKIAYASDPDTTINILIAKFQSSWRGRSRHLNNRDIQMCEHAEKILADLCNYRFCNRNNSYTSESNGTVTINPYLAFKETMKYFRKRLKALS
ncbi:MAG: hypothetical protein KAU17_10400 [Spirochaetales bacterium]|nr:hypothetical protein [Spirochaetales bacterium]